MTRVDDALAAAQEYGRKHLCSGQLASAEIAGEAIDVGGGRESWLVKIRGQRRSWVVAVLVNPDGTAEVTHHTRMAA